MLLEKTNETYVCSLEFATVSLFSVIWIMSDSKKQMTMKDSWWAYTEKPFSSYCAGLSHFHSLLNTHHNHCSLIHLSLCSLSCCSLLIHIFTVCVHNFIVLLWIFHLFVSACSAHLCSASLCDTAAISPLPSSSSSPHSHAKVSGRVYMIMDRWVSARFLWHPSPSHFTSESELSPPLAIRPPPLNWLVPVALFLPVMVYWWSSEICYI